MSLIKAAEKINHHHKKFQVSFRSMPNLKDFLLITLVTSVRLVFRVVTQSVRYCTI